MFESQMMNTIAVLGSILESNQRNASLPQSDENSRRWDEPELAPIRAIFKTDHPMTDLRALSVFQTNPGKLAVNTKCVENC